MPSFSASYLYEQHYYYIINWVICVVCWWKSRDCTDDARSKCLLSLLYIVLRHEAGPGIQESLTFEELWFGSKTGFISWRLPSQMLPLHVMTPVVIWFVVYCSISDFSTSFVCFCGSFCKRGSIRFLRLAPPHPALVAIVTHLVIQSIVCNS